MNLHFHDTIPSLGRYCHVPSVQLRPELYFLGLSCSSLLGGVVVLAVPPSTKMLVHRHMFVLFWLDHLSRSMVQWYQSIDPAQTRAGFLPCFLFSCFLMWQRFFHTFFSSKFGLLNTLTLLQFF